MTGHFCVQNCPSVQEQRALNANKAKRGQLARQTFDGIPADVLGVARSDDYVVAVRLDVVYFRRVKRIESMLTLTDQKRRFDPRDVSLKSLADSLHIKTVGAHRLHQVIKRALREGGRSMLAS